MTKNELTVFGFVCAGFGWIFSFLHSYDIALIIFFIGMIAWVWWLVLYIKDFMEKGGGPPAAV